MICKKCGCRVSDTATFCDKCGASMTEFGQKEATVESVKKSPSTKKIVIAVVVLILCCALFVFPKTRQVSATNKAVTAIRVEKSDSAKVTEAYADFIGPDPVRVYVVLENGHDYLCTVYSGKTVEVLTKKSYPYGDSYLFDKVGQAVRLSPGADLSGKLLSIGSGFSAAFSNALPSFAPMDLLIGIVGAVVIRLAVYVKGKNAKKYRKGMEYGSARWGNAEDIKPYIDPMFENNVLLTQTERLMMSSRPKHPKYARNKNVLVIGGSGSGKTRFFVKPNLMQMHSSYVVTDPKGTVLIECGKLLQRGGYKIKVLNTINFKKSMRYNRATCLPLKRRRTALFQSVL